MLEIDLDVFAAANPPNCRNKSDSGIWFHQDSLPRWIALADRQRCQAVVHKGSELLARKRLKVDPKRKLKLTRRRHEFRRAETGIARRGRRNMVSELLWYRPYEIGQTVHVVHVFHVRPIE